MLAKIEEAGLIESDDSEVRVISSGETIDEDVRSLAGQFETLRTQDGRRLDAFAEYARATDCRAVFLRGYFGEEADVPCGLCDICRGRARPAGRLLRAARPAEAPREEGARQATARRGSREVRETRTTARAAQEEDFLRIGRFAEAIATATATMTEADPEIVLPR